MAWGYLARAYAIKDYVDLRVADAESLSPMPDEIADSFDEVLSDIKIVLEIAEDNFISVKETPHEYQTIRQCKKWLRDFKNK